MSRRPTDPGQRAPAPVTRRGTGRRGVSILPWDGAPPADHPAPPRASRPPARRTWVPPAGLVSSEGVTEAGASAWLPPTRRQRAPVTHRPAPPVPPAPPFPTAPPVRPAPPARSAPGPTARPHPGLGWRARLYTGTGGRVNLGPGPAERDRLDRLRRVRRPLPGPYRLAVTSIKGGIGKTTVAAVLGLTLAEHRDGSRVLALDADPDAGTLADRLSGPSSVGVRQLLADLDSVTTPDLLARYTTLAGGLRVLAGDQDPAAGEAFREQDYRRICTTLDRFHDLLVTDCGTGLAHSAMAGALGLADRLVVVGAPTVDGASRADKTLDWLRAHGHHRLADQAVLVLCQDRAGPHIDRAAVREHFARRCRHVLEIPADPHLAGGGVIVPSRLAPATRDVFLELAAVIADGFGGG